MPNEHAHLLEKLKNCIRPSLHVIRPSNSMGQYLHWNERLAKHYIQWAYPIRLVTITKRKPKFVTPGVKYLLRWKNKLIKRNRIEEAGAIEEQIGNAITRANRPKSQLRNVSHSGNTRELWKMVGEHTKRIPKPKHQSTITTEVLNAHYLSIYNDPEYVVPQTSPHSEKLLFLEMLVLLVIILLLGL